MRIKTRIATAALAVAALTLPLAACSGGDSSGGGSAGGQVELNFFHRWPNEPKKTYFDNLVKEFEAENPDITIKTESVLNDNYKDKIKVVAGSANAPDVMFTWSGSFIAELVKGDALMDLGPWLAEDTDFRDSFYESQLPPFAEGDAQYGLPIGMHSKVFYYNTEIFDEYGLTAPKTWDEFLTVLDTIEQKSGKHAIEFGAVDTWTIAHYLGTLNQRVVDPAVFVADQDPAKGEFTDPGYVTALERLAEISKHVNADFLAIDHEMARNAWMSGEGAPLFYAQSAEIGYFTDVAFDYSVFNFPAVAGGKGDPDQLTGAPEGFAISKNTKHPEEAKKFLKFMLSKANGIAYTETTGELSAVQGAVDEADVSDTTKELAQQILDASEMTAWLDNAYDPQIVATYLTETQLMLGGQQTPEGVMEKVQETAKRVRDAS
ncbi:MULTISPECIES: ABC transporter substrate-binding protein [Microbacterium]|uniref:ABC transporter substrate-binding protein n=1 Tax=Microbacterium TaxID=33882 RepID=UPI001E581212|nr:extracellular solute-binding protein [Microbacterium nymphoidis]MCD2498306.1 extracellular solute-binding protein [Microbacterium nymphoidis]